MRIRERQRTVLVCIGRLDREISEEEVHMIIKLSQECSNQPLYTFSPGFWSDIDERFPNKHGAVPISRELHTDIVDMVEKGYVVRNKKLPLLIKAAGVEALFGRWFSRTLAGDFEMHIYGKRRKNCLEEIGGDITDGFGLAHFWGERDCERIKFTKLYDPGSHPTAIRSEITYQGEKQEGVYKGTYNFMHQGEIPKNGNFILAKRKEDLPLPPSLI